MNRPRLGALILTATGLAISLVGCRTDSELNRFDQSWETALSETSCLQWVDDMSARERFAAAAELLLAARDETAGFPTDTQFTYFMSRITDACRDAPGSRVTDTSEAIFSDLESQLGN